MLLYKKITVDNFKEIRLELENNTKFIIEDNLRYWDPPIEWMNANATLLMNFINSRKKCDVRFCRIYNTPPMNILKPHIDGPKYNRSPLGFNIPIVGHENTTMSWYSCPDDNLIDGPFGFNDRSAAKIIDLTLLNKIDTTVIDCPTFVRTDVIHGIINNTNVNRIVLSVRFMYSNTIYQNFDDVFEFD